MDLYQVYSIRICFENKYKELGTDRLVLSVHAVDLCHIKLVAILSCKITDSG